MPPILTPNMGKGVHSLPLIPTGSELLRVRWNPSLNDTPEIRTLQSVLRTHSYVPNMLS